MRRKTLLFLLLFTCAFSIKKGYLDSVPDFHSVHMTDPEAYPMGSTGIQPDDDYQMEEWENHIVHFFYPFNAVLIPLKEKFPIPVFCSFYPNPCESWQAVNINVEQAVNFRMVIIDSLSNVRYRKSVDLSRGNNNVLFNYKDLEGGHHYRIYYGLSYRGHPFYYRAHADFIKN